MERENQQTIVYDRLYGQFEMPRGVRALLETPEFARLHRVSLEATPAGFSPTSTASSKAEHSLGVSHLADILVGRKPEFAALGPNIIFASALHDVATPPFSHTTDHFVEEALGVNHEGWAKDIILNSQSLIKVIRENGADPQIVASLITGEAKPFSDLVAGSIDLDNLDNTPRWGLSMGFLRNLPYDPQYLATRFGILDGQVVLQADPKDLEGWEKVRQDMYKFVYGEDHLSSAMMLYRALELLFRDDLLPKEFFRMNDEEALEFIRRKQHRGSFALVEDALCWRRYPMIFERETQGPTSGELVFTSRWTMRDIFASSLASEFGFRAHEVCVYTGRDKGYRKIHLPLIDETGDVWFHNPPQEQTHMIKVFVHPKYTDQEEKIQTFCQELLESGEFITSGVPESPQTGY